MRHTEKQCQGMHCKCMRADCASEHYADHIQECGHTEAEHLEAGCGNVGRDKEIGGKIHKLLNYTLSRKLTVTEYKSLVKLIGTIFKALRESARSTEN